MRALVTGARGQLASDLVAASADHDLVGLTEHQLDITDEAAVAAAVDHHAPTWSSTPRR